MTRGVDAVLPATRVVYVSLVNGVSPPLAHLDRDCRRHQAKPPRRVSTSWNEAVNAGCRLCSTCANNEGIEIASDRRRSSDVDSVDNSATPHQR